MGQFSRLIFGREKLPRYAVIRAGAHFKDRAYRTLDQFDSADELKGTWMPYSFAKVEDKEVLVVFNVYGAAPTLEILRIFEDGGVEIVGFIGSAFSKEDEIGRQLLVRSVFDQAGIVQLTGRERVIRRSQLVDKQREIFAIHNVDFSEVNIASVPCVMHNIDSVKEFVEKDEIDGVEMELSTFFHFSEEANMDSYAMIYVSDNPQNPLVNVDKQEIRNLAITESSKLMVELIKTI